MTNPFRSISSWYRGIPGSGRVIVGLIVLVGAIYLPNLGSVPGIGPQIITHGLQGPVTVNGKEYNSIMPPMSQLTDDEVANISTYVLNSWGNPGGRITKDEAAQIRKSTPANASQGH